MKSFGLDPNPEGTPYTIPAIRFSDNTYMMDSRKIAAELEKRHPSPSLHLDSELLPRVEDLLAKSLMHMRPVLIPKTPDALLNPPSKEYFERTREQMFGKSLEHMEKEQGGEEAWKAAEPALKEIGDVLRARGGPFMMGKEGECGFSLAVVAEGLIFGAVSYTDFVIVGLLQFAKRVREDLYGQTVEMEPALKTLYDASAVWLERDDH